MKTHPPPHFFTVYIPIGHIHHIAEEAEGSAGTPLGSPPQEKGASTTKQHHKQPGKVYTKKTRESRKAELWTAGLHFLWLSFSRQAAGSHRHLETQPKQREPFRQLRN